MTKLPKKKSLCKILLQVSDDDVALLINVMEIMRLI